MKKLFFLFAAVMVAAVAMAQTPTVSASSVTFKYCQTTYGTVEVSYVDNPSWHGESFTPGTYVRTIQNARGCDSIVTVEVLRAQGAIPYAFTVADNKRVWFSKGNLQYCAVPVPGQETTHTTRDTPKLGVWRFAEHQWDYVGYASYGTVYVGNVKSNNANRAEDYQGWIDQYLLPGTGYVHYCSNCSPKYKYYHPYNNQGLENLQDNINNTNYSWGYYNSISNGGNVTSAWFVLTRDEWRYIFKYRDGHDDKYSGGKVNNVPGLIILPDDWTLPAGLTFTPKQNNVTTNVYSAQQWALMEANGAVFLPGVGYSNSQSDGEKYWMADKYSWYEQYCLSISNTGSVSYENSYIQGTGTSYRLAVRLVRTVQ